MSVNDRISLLVERLAEGNSGEFSRKLGIAYTTMKSYLDGRKPNYDTLSKIIEVYPQVNARWLLNGQGDPFEEISEPVSPKTEKDDIEMLKGQVAEISKTLKGLVKAVSEKA